MNHAQGSSVSHARLSSAAAFAAVLFAALFVIPGLSAAATVWQSTGSHSDELQVYTPQAAHHWFGTQDLATIDLGMWTGNDLTTDASTTVHIWARWNNTISPQLDFILRGSTGGDPYYNVATTTAQLVAMPGNYDSIVVYATSSSQEYIIPATVGQTIHQGDEVWAFFVPSWSAYGANHWLGASSTMPFVQVCEGDCSQLVATISPPTCTQDCYSNVLFLPGVEASRLYGTDSNGQEQKLWEPDTSADAEQLAFNAGGTSERSDIYTRDVLDNAYIPEKGNVYASFITDMDTLKKNGTINDWLAAPYDWRLSLDQILVSGNQSGPGISYLNATDTPYIIQELKQLAATSKTGKVTIIAHSNGGLVAKAMMQELGDTETSKLIDKVIFVAVPQVGTPQAIAGLLHGYDEGLPFNAFPNKLSPAAAREVGDTMPGLYYLLPSASYFTSVDDPVATFSASLPDWQAKYGNVIHSVDRMTSFLTDATRTQPDSLDLNDPTTLNANDVAAAETAHQSLDAWQPPAGVQVIQIAGWGIPTTVSGVDYDLGFKDENSFDLTPTTTAISSPVFTVDGDGTVVVPSALWMSAGSDVQDYWVDLQKYNDVNWVSTLGGNNNGFAPFDHARIFEVSNLLDFLNDQITDSVKTLSSYSYVSATAPVSTAHRLRFALHSPLTLDIYDAQGNHTGISTTTGEVEENIPGTYYTTFAGVQYIFADIADPVHIVMNGYANGTFAFDVDELDSNDNVVASTTFEDVPTTPQTIVTMDVAGSIANASPLLVDENGDGTTDITLQPGGTVVYQPPAPTSPPPPQPTPQPSQSATVPPVPISSGDGNGPPVSTDPLAPTTTAPVSATSTVATSSAQTQFAVVSTSTDELVPESSPTSKIIRTKTYAVSTIHSHVAKQTSKNPGNARLLAGAAASLSLVNSPSPTVVQSTKLIPEWLQYFYKKVENKLRALI